MRFIVALVALVVSDAASAQQQRQTFKDASGRTLGRSVTDAKGNTTFYDHLGRNTGRAVTRGGSTTTSDSMGRQTGTIRSNR